MTSIAISTRTSFGESVMATQDTNNDVKKLPQLWSWHFTRFAQSVMLGGLSLTKSEQRLSAVGKLRTCHTSSIATANTATYSAQASVVKVRFETRLAVLYWAFHLIKSDTIVEIINTINSLLTEQNEVLLQLTYVMSSVRLFVWMSRHSLTDRCTWFVMKFVCMKSKLCVYKKEVLKLSFFSKSY